MLYHSSDSSCVGLGIFMIELMLPQIACQCKKVHVLAAWVQPLVLCGCAAVGFAFDMAAPAAARKLNPTLSWARAPPATVVKPSTRPSGAGFGTVREGDEDLELGQPVEVSGNHQTKCQCSCIPRRCVSAFMGASTVSQRGWMIYDWADSIFVVASTYEFTGMQTSRQLHCTTFHCRLFIAPFISKLAEANGESDGRAFYSFVQSASTIASILVRQCFHLARDKPHHRQPHSIAGIRVSFGPWRVWLH